MDETANLQKPETAKQVAKRAGISERQLFKGAELIRRGRQDLFDKVLAGEMSMHAAYLEARGESKPTSWDRLVTAWNSATDEDHARFMEELGFPYEAAKIRSRIAICLPDQERQHCKFAVGGLTMRRQGNKLSALEVARMKKPGRYGDGHGLWLQVGPTGSKSWCFVYRRGATQHVMGLGALYAVSLQDARVKAKQANQCLADGGDPISVKREAAAAALKVMTFQQVAEEFLQTDKIQTLKSDKHKAQWHSTLQVAFKAIGKLPIQSIDTKMILDFLMPIWRKTPETCTRIRGRCEAIFNYAISLNRFEGLNPARREVFAAHFTGRVRGHHKAISYEQLPAFVQRLRQRDGVSAKALELLVLTASRTSEVIGCKWSEVDLDKALWEIPGQRMKSGVSHAVPLPPRAVSILRELPRTSEFVFVNGDNKAISNMAMLSLMQKGMGVDATPHGMRSAFNTWAKNCTNYAPETRNAALAHTEEKLEAAYTRDKNRVMFDKRRRLMAEWAKFLSGDSARTGDNVVSMRSA